MKTILETSTSLGRFKVELYKRTTDPKDVGAELTEVCVRLEMTDEGEETRDILEVPLSALSRALNAAQVATGTSPFLVESVSATKHWCTVCLEYDTEEQLSKMSVEGVSNLRTEYLETLGLAVLFEFSERAQNHRSTAKTPKEEG